MSSSEPPPAPADLLADAGEEVAALKAFARRMLEVPDGAPVPEEVLQQGLTAMARLYGVRFQEGERFSPFVSAGAVPATAAMILATASLRAVNVELFELGMWQSWSGA